MGIFSNIMAKIVGHSARAQESKTNAAVAANAPAPGIQPSAPAAAPVMVDIRAELASMAAANKQKLDWENSIVDLMKLVGMDSSLAERRELAKELGYTGSTDDTATMNTWLHKEVMKKMSENGGKVPANMLD